MSVETTPPRSIGRPSTRDRDPALLLAATDDLVARRVDEVAGLLRSVGGTPLAYGGHGLDLAAELRLRTSVTGKQVRPLLALAGHRAAGGDSGDPALARLTAALELLHLFALVHDDVMDRSATRRGLPTVHREAADRHRRSGARGDPERYGDAAAVLVGDLLLAEAGTVVASLPTGVRETWRLMVVELVQGQLLDVTATASPLPPDAGASALVARLKTGRYTVRRPLELGALLAGGDPGLLEALGRWGDLVGDAFGLRDDLLGVWGDPRRTGKPGLDDLLDGTATRLLAWATEMMDGPAVILLEQVRAGSLSRSDAERLAEAMAAAGVADRAEAEIDRLLAEAQQVLHPLVPTSQHHHFDGLAARLARRNR